MKPTRERILDMLTSPRPVSEIAAALEISSQAVHQHLKGLIAEHRVRSVRRQRGARRVWYSRVDDPADPPDMIVPERFDGASDRLLRRLRPDTIYGMDQLGEVLSTDPPHVTLTVDKLVLDGHLWTMKVAGRRLCLLTRQGAVYGSEIGRQEAARSEPIASLISERRTEVLLALARRPGRSLKELKAASVVLEKSSDVQLSRAVKSLREDGLLVSRTDHYPGRHSLTPMGTLLATYVLQQG